MNWFSSPNTSKISSSLDKPNALNSVVIVTLRVLSILTYTTSLASSSNSNHVPRLGIISPDTTGRPFLSISLLK